MTPLPDLVTFYLRTLSRELRGVPADQRRELLDAIREHIATAVAELPGGAGRTEAGVRGVLDRLGDPAIIAAQARAEAGLPAPAGQPDSPGEPGGTGGRSGAGTRGGSPGIALAVLGVGGTLVPGIGLLVGAVFVARARGWTRRQKAIGLLWPMSVAVGVAVVVAVTLRFWSPEPFLLVGLIGPLLSVAALAGMLPPRVDDREAVAWSLALGLAAVAVGSAFFALARPAGWGLALFLAVGLVLQVAVRRRPRSAVSR